MYIRLDGQWVTYGTMISPETEPHHDWIEYLGDIPDAELVIWDEQSNTVVVSPDELPRVRARKLAEIAAIASAKLDALVSRYPQLERETWTKQETDARALIADPTYGTAFLTTYATELGVPVEDLASNIVAKADLYEVAVGNILGKRGRLLAEVDAVPTDDTYIDAIARIKNIHWDTPVTNDELL